MIQKLTEKQVREHDWSKYGYGERPVCKIKCDCLDCEARVLHMMHKGVFHQLSDYED